MFRLLTIFMLVIGFVAAAWANVPTPPPPPEKKYVDVRNQVRLGKEFDDYVFFIERSHHLAIEQQAYSKIALSTKDPTSMPAASRYEDISLLAIPKASADQVRSFEPGVRRTDFSKIPGLRRLGFDYKATVDINHPVGSVTRTYTITGFGKKGGMETTVEREPADDEGVGTNKLKSPAKAEQDKTGTEAEPSKTRSIVAGVALALSFAASGLLLVRRRRACVVQTRD